MSRRICHLTILTLITSILAGCAYGISRQNRASALKNLAPRGILEEFETYKGKLVLMGGEIIKTSNLEKGTLIEVIQKPLSRFSDRPTTGQEYDGRFLVRYRSFKDPYVFSAGREITVAGIVADREVLTIDQREYTYVVLENRETHLWAELEEYPGGYPYTYPPPWWYYPPRPYWHPRPYRH